LRNVVKYGKYSLQSLQILYTFVVLRAEIATIFGTNVVGISARNTKYANLEGYIFRILQHFATKLCNFTHFSMLFLAVVI
jgi:hypothetical protein